MIRNATQLGTGAVKLLCGGLLLWALYPQNPYGYYILLRWVCCSAFAYFAIRYFRSGEIPWAWIFGTAEGIYNPILRVHLDRTLWSIVNIATIIMLVASVTADMKHQKKSDSEES